MPLTLMIVDDSRVARMVALGIVRRLRPDWQVIEAGNAGEARVALGEKAVDVVLLDVNMPGERGIDLARDLRANRPDLPIAIVSANVQDDIAAAAREIDVTFVPKPLTDEGIAPFFSAAALRLRRAGAA